MLQNYEELRIIPNIGDILHTIVMNNIKTMKYFCIMERKIIDD